METMTANKVKQNLAPMLRFSGFNKQWNIKSVNDLVEEKIIEKPLDGNHGNIHPVASDFVKTGIPFIMANCFKDGMININKAVCINKAQADKLQKGFSKTGDVLLTHKGSVGLTAIVPDISTEYIMLTPQVTYYRVLKNSILLNTFLKATFDSQQFQKRLKTLADSGTRPYIGITLQRTLNIPVPSLPEQQKIASFLSKVDEKIQLLTRKKELLENYKKGAMQQLFSQKLRFKDANGKYFPDWEEKKMGDLISFLADYTANGSFKSLKDNVQYYSVENYAVLVRTTDLEKSTFKPERFTDKKGYDFLKKTSLFGGELVMANVGSIGKIYRVPYYNKPMTLAPNTYTLKFHSNCDIDFYYQWMLTDLFKNKLLSMVGSSTLMAINKSNLRDIDTFQPSLKEQQKIASFLSAIDEKIEAVNQQITQSQTFKKGLLQQMFV